MAGIDMIQSTRQQGSQEVMLQRDWEELSQNFFFVPHSFPKYQDHIKKKMNTLWNFEQSVASSNCEI